MIDAVLVYTEPVPEGRGCFNERRDNELIAAGTHFFCGGHISAMPIDDMSPDPRYCQGCYNFLLNEESTLPKNKRPSWIPKTPKIRAGKAIPRPGVPVLNMSILNGEQGKGSVVDIIKSVTPGKRGPKQKALPVELINQLAVEGLTAKAIAAKLAEQGVVVSYKTVERILTGQRVLV